MEYYFKSHPVWKAVGISLALQGSICICQSAMLMQLAIFTSEAIIGYYLTVLMGYGMDILVEKIGNCFDGIMGAMDERRHRWQEFVLPGTEEPVVQQVIRGRELRPRPKFPGRRPVTRSMSRAMAAARV